MKKRVFNLLSACSLLMLCLMVYAWIASHWHPREFTYTYSDPYLNILGVGWDRGAMYLYHHSYQMMSPERDGWAWAFPSVRWSGFDYFSDLSGTVRFLLNVPIWSLVCLFGTLPSVWLYRRLRHRHPPGLCPTCGYDLRASPERCPECGTRVESSTISSSA